MIRLENVSLNLGNSELSSCLSFKLPKFIVGDGEAVALTGPSGCGKSTLLNLIAGLHRCDEGVVEVAGVEINSLSAAGIDRHRGVHCGMIFQTFHLLAPFSALENVLIGQSFGGRQKDKTKQRAKDVLVRVGLGHRLDARPHQLSVGECQRVAIARAIISNPNIVLADEPTGSLDPQTAEEIFDLLMEISSEDKRTLIMVTHDLSLAGKFPRSFDCSGLIRSEIS